MSVSVNDRVASQVTQPPASTVKQEDNDISTGVTPLPINGSSHPVNGHTSEHTKMHDVMSGLCSLYIFSCVRLTGFLKKLHSDIRISSIRTPGLPTAALLHLQQPPSVLSPSPSHHRPPTDLLCTSSVSFVIFVYLADDPDSNAVENINTGQQGEYLCSPSTMTVFLTSLLKRRTSCSLFYSAIILAFIQPKRSKNKWQGFLP